jgi:hypothetical protein
MLAGGSLLPSESDAAARDEEMTRQVMELRRNLPVVVQQELCLSDGTDCGTSSGFGRGRCGTRIFPSSGMSFFENQSGPFEIATA